MSEDVERVKTLQGLMVREYHTFWKIHRRYIQLSNFGQEQSNREFEWPDEIAKRQTNTLTSLTKYLETQKETDNRSSVSAKSSASSTLAKLQEAERLEKETELRIKQERNEAAEQAGEEERIQQIESARKMEEKRIEAARKDRQLTMELEKQRLTGSFLRQQLQGESTDCQDNGRNQTLPNFDATSRQNIPLAPTRPPAITAPSGSTTSTHPTSLKHEPAVPQPSFTPFSSFNVNAPGFIPSLETGQKNASTNQPFNTNNRLSFLSSAALYSSSINAANPIRHSIRLKSIYSAAVFGLHPWWLDIYNWSPWLTANITSFVKTTEGRATEIRRQSEKLSNVHTIFQGTNSWHLL